MKIILEAVWKVAFERVAARLRVIRKWNFTIGSPCGNARQTGISAGLPTAGCEARFPPALVIPATRSIEPEPVFRACLAEASGEAQVGRSRFSLENPSRGASAHFRDSFLEIAKLEIENLPAFVHFRSGLFGVHRKEIKSATVVAFSYGIGYWLGGSGEYIGLLRQFAGFGRGLLLAPIFSALSVLPSPARLLSDVFHTPLVSHRHRTAF